jgi:hypothetical protein
LIFARKKSPHCSGAGFFQYFLYASARTVTCGNGDGCNSGNRADACHGCCALYYYLSVLYAYIG